MNAFNSANAALLQEGLPVTASAEVVELRRTVTGSVSEKIGADPLVSDVFQLNGKEIGVRHESRILSGHFNGMPVVPWVLSKRLFASLADVDLYRGAGEAGRFAWKTEFPSAMNPETKGLEVKTVDGAQVLTDGTKTYLKTVLKNADGDVSDRMLNFRSVHLKDLYLEVVERIPYDDPDKYVLQSKPFRFVTTGGSTWLCDNEESPKILWGSFVVPLDFAYVDEDGNVPHEIVEESVAQIASLAYAKTRNFPEMRLENGDLNPKAKVLTFKSSVAEAGKRRLLNGDHLSVVVEIVEEDERTVKFEYEAWNAIRDDVLRWTIEWSVVPLRLLKRMAA